MRMKEIPTHDRPRERGLREGAATLSDSELIAILLRSGKKGSSALDLAHTILSRTNGHLSEIWLGKEDLFRPAGISPIQQITLQAALELGHRLHRDVQPPITLEDALFDLTRKLRVLDREVFVLIPLDSRTKCIGSPIFLQTGSRSLVHVDPKEVIRAALQRGCTRLALVHNHPSGESFPSSNDILLTKQIIEGAKWVDLEVWDHIILTSNDTFSFREHGLLD